MQAAHTHCFCGGSVNAGDHTSHKDVTYTACTKSNYLRQIFYIEKVDVAYAYLENDITLDYHLSIQEGKTLYLCLNGHTLNLGEYNILVGSEGATLYLCDCSAQKTGTVSGGSTGCVSLYDASDHNATFNMYGGTLRDGKKSCGGVDVDAGTMNMYGGTITENTATSDGGGIYVGTKSTLNLYGGTITKNTVSTNEGHHGGGVYVESNKWSGVGKISISGSPVITGNTRTYTPDSTTTTENVYLGYGFTNSGDLPIITLGTVTSGANIGISASKTVFSTASETDYSNYFFSDDTGYHVEYNADKKLELKSGSAHVHSGGTATCTQKAVCSICGKAYGELAEHKFTAEVAEKQYLKSAATCTAKAVYYKSCAVCGAKGTETFEFGEKAAHDFTAEVAEEQYLKSAATCTAKAVYYKSCAVCGEKGTETFEFGKELGHDFTAEVAEEQYLKSAASCTAKAVYYKSCAVCGEKSTETFEFGEKDSNNHSGREEWTITATTHEKMWNCCSKVTVDKAKHSFGEWTVKKQPTFTEEGEREHTCTICDYQETESIPVIDCTLHFETNGGSDISDLYKPYNTTIDLAKYEPTRSGYRFTDWYTDEALTDKVTSIQLTGDMTIYAGWKVVVVNPFTDVCQSDWFYDDVQYVYENGLMKGTATDQFSPKMSTTRGMIVTILYRMENEPAVSDNCPFDDVKADAYYEKAITWAATNGIVLGYGHDKFGPEDNITREQMTTILYRYAKYKGIDVSVGEDTNILSYNDAFDVSDYAVLSMQWACGTGLIKGSSGNNLLPKDPATRAQVAAILHRFCENF